MPLTMTWCREPAASLPDLLGITNHYHSHAFTITKILTALYIKKSKSYTHEGTGKKIILQSTKKGNLLFGRKLPKTSKLKQEVLMNEVDGIKIKEFLNSRRRFVGLGITWLWGST
jgi:hypothetical protein